MFRIICDSSCDIKVQEKVYSEENYAETERSEYTNQWEKLYPPEIDLAIVPIYIYNSDHSYYDNVYLDIHKMLDELEGYEGRTYSCCPSVMSWVDAFSEKKENYVITLTGGISGTYNSACTARDIFREDYPDARICVIDSLSTGPEMKLIVDKIIEMKKQGMTFAQVSEAITAYVKEVRMFLLLRSASHLLDNGRIHKLDRNVLDVLRYHVLAFFTNEGKIEVLKKLRGEKKTISGSIREMERLGYAGGKVRITYVEQAGFALAYGRSLRKRYPHASIEYGEAGGLCSFYMERGGLMIAFEAALS